VQAAGAAENHPFDQLLGGEVAQAAVAELSPELRKAVQAWPRSVKALAALTH
jgi:hypothetical protein